MQHRLALVAVFLLTLSSTTMVRGHMVMTAPQPRSTNNNLTVGPCGEVAAGPITLTVGVGDGFTVRGQETLPHDGTIDVNLLDANERLIVQLGSIPSPGVAPYNIFVNVPESPAFDHAIIQVVLNSSTVDYFACADIRTLALGDPGVDPGNNGAGAGAGQAGPGFGGGGSDLTTTLVLVGGVVVLCIALAALFISLRKRRVASSRRPYAAIERGSSGGSSIGSADSKSSWSSSVVSLPRARSPSKPRPAAAHSKSAGKRSGRGLRVRVMPPEGRV